MSSPRDGAASRDYAVAYATHYSDRNLVTALELYQELVTAYPDAREAGYTRTRMAKIVGSVVPQADLLDAQLALAFEDLGDRQDFGCTTNPAPRDPGQHE